MTKPFASVENKIPILTCTNTEKIDDLT